MMPTARRRVRAPHVHCQPPEVVAEDQRRRILAAVPPVLATHGYGGLTVRHIIERAGVSRRTFYDLYVGKVDAFVAAHEEILALLCARVDVACATAADWPAKVRAGLGATLDLAATEPLRMRLLVAEPLTAGPRPAYCHDLLVERFASRLRPGRCHAGGTPFPALEEMLVGGVAEILATRLRSDRADTLPELAPQLAELVLTPYLGLAETRRLARS
jgi:AcrR family transcriptional regulator